MEVSVESISALEKRLQVKVEEEKISSIVKKRLLSMAKTTRINGFRLGKAPLKILQKQYGQQVRKEAMNQVMQDSLQEAIVQEKLQLASRPELEDFDQQQTQGLQFTAKIEILPEITIAPLENLKIEKPICKISDDDVNQMIEIIRKQHSTAQEVARVAIAGDVVVVDFIGRIDGQEFAGGTGNDISIELGAKQFIPGFEEGLIGLGAKDHKILPIQFPDDYGKQDFAGKAVDFEVTVKIIKELVLPELDSKLFNTLGVKDGGIEAFKAEILSNISRESEQIIENKIKEYVMQQLYEANKIMLPPSLISAEIQRLYEQWCATIKKQNPEQQNIPECDSAVFHEQAKKRVTLQLLVTNLARENKISADSAIVHNMIEKMAARYEDSAEVVAWYYADKKRLVEIEALAVENAVINYIMQKADIKEQELTFDALRNNRQTA